jgi:hypothetical protein
MRLTNLAYPIPRDTRPLAMNRTKRDKPGHTPALHTYAQTEEKEDTRSQNRDAFETARRKTHAGSTENIHWVNHLFRLFGMSLRYVAILAERQHAV